ncbi:MAG: hypothetical protein ACODAC_06565 [Pseudomonadota bacterium]
MSVRAASLLWRGLRRRRLGRYDRETLRLFRRAHRTGDHHALLHYVQFRRDLGHALHPRFVEPLLDAFPRLTQGQQWRAGALLREIGADPPWIWQHLKPGPGLAAAKHQGHWRAGLCNALRERQRAGIVVVGNANSLLGTNVGRIIDRGGLVLRFNDTGDLAERAAHLGQRTDVWVTSPAYHGPTIKKPDWVIVSGPDVCYTLRDWSLHAGRLRAARPVVTVPLAVWRDLAGALNAPPSAGVLILAWIHAMLGTWIGVQAAGIGFGIDRRYHHAHRRLRAGSRHDWAAEADLVDAWTQRGLRILPESHARRARPASLVDSRR